MFKNKSKNGKNNIFGLKIRKLRQNAVPKMSQRILAEKLQLLGIDVDLSLHDIMSYYIISSLKTKLLAYPVLSKCCSITSNGNVLIPRMPTRHR